MKAYFTEIQFVTLTFLKISMYTYSFVWSFLIVLPLFMQL